MTESKAREALEEAIQNYISAAGWNQNMVTTGWITVVDQRGFSDGEGISGYPLIYMGGSMPDAQAIGLLQIGMDVVRGVGRWIRADDDG